MITRCSALPLCRRSAISVETEIIEADGLDSAREVLGRRADVDLILLDLHMPGSHGLMGLVSLRSEFPAVAVINDFGGNDDPLVMRRALTYGAAGFIPKRSSIGEIQSMLRAVIACEDLPPSALNDRHGSEAAHDRELAKRLATLSPPATARAWPGCRWPARQVYCPPPGYPGAHGQCTRAPCSSASMCATARKPAPCCAHSKSPIPR